MIHLSERFDRDQINLLEITYIISDICVEKNLVLKVVQGFAKSDLNYFLKTHSSYPFSIISLLIKVIIYNLFLRGIQ